MIINVGSGGGGYVLTVVAPVGASVTVSKDSKTYTGTVGSSGTAIFKNLSKGTWSVTVSDGTTSKTETVEITEDCTIEVILNAIPAFTYDGTYQIVNDDDVEITTSPDNWKIRFLTGGTLKFTALNGAADGIDVFCVGGGGNGKEAGGGGGGGYTTTKKNVAVQADYSYSIVVGGAAGKSSGFGVSANGGKTPSSTTGGDGGSGGGFGNGDGNAGKGGSDGSNGYGHGVTTEGKGGGKGQGATTREFGESGATLYSGGGGGGTFGQGTTMAGGAGGGGAGEPNGTNGGNGTTNTGGGGGGCGAWATGGTGGSGIVIIRNTR